MSKKSAKVKVVRATQSPMNALRWSCDLLCGHSVWVTSRRAPKYAECPRADAHGAPRLSARRGKEKTL